MSGNLVQAMGDAVSLVEAQARIRATIWQALLYPSALSAMMVFLLCIVAYRMVPSFSSNGPTTSLAGCSARSAPAARHAASPTTSTTIRSAKPTRVSSPTARPSTPSTGWSARAIPQQQWAYDELGRLLRAVGAGGQTRSFAYDLNDNPVGETNPRQFAHSQAFDALDRLVGQSDPTPAPRSDHFFFPSWMA